ncbi:MAG: OmpH family outer membrane protein [Phycisphaerae bacterium]|nr:OmpH family outer membrane protein [Phycisphaerae bacterium]
MTKQRTNQMTNHAATSHSYARGLIVATLTTLVAGLIALASFAPSRPANIAMVDFEKVFNNCNLHANREAQLRKMAAGFDTQVTALKKTLAALQEEIDLFSPTSSGFLAKQDEIHAAIGNFKAFDQFARVKMEAERAKSMRETYEAIKAAAKSYATKHGHDLVLLDDSIPDMIPSDAQKTLQQISARRFLYADPTFEISGDLIAEINAAYPLAPGVTLPSTPTATAPVNGGGSGVGTAPASAGGNTAAADNAKP